MGSRSYFPLLLQPFKGCPRSLIIIYSMLWRTGSAISYPRLQSIECITCESEGHELLGKQSTFRFTQWFHYKTVISWISPVEEETSRMDSSTGVASGIHPSIVSLPTVWHPIMWVPRNFYLKIVAPLTEPVPQELPFIPFLSLGNTVKVRG